MATQLILRADYEGALWYKNGDWYNPYSLICIQNEENEVEINNLITRIDNWLDFYKASELPTPYECWCRLPIQQIA